MEIYGANFAASAMDWTTAIASGQAPTLLNGVSVSINNRPGFLSYVGPNQINVQVPTGIGAGPSTLTVTNPAGTSDTYVVTVAQAAPSFLAPPQFKDRVGRQFVAAVFPDSNLNGPFVGQPNFLGPEIVTRSARPGDRIILYAVGLGPVNPQQEAGRIITVPNTIAAFSLRFGGVAVVTEYAGLATGQVGLYQINCIVPDLGTGEFEISGTMVGGIAVPPGLFINLR
jgi:uncharacterized protein (TIGR03437 family)